MSQPALPVQTSIVGVEFGWGSAIIIRDNIAVSSDGLIGINVLDDLRVPLEVRRNSGTSNDTAPRNHGNARRYTRIKAKMLPSD